MSKVNKVSSEKVVSNNSKAKSNVATNKAKNETIFSTSNKTKTKGNSVSNSKFLFSKSDEVANVSKDKLHRDEMAEVRKDLTHVIRRVGEETYKKVYDEVPTDKIDKLKNAKIEREISNAKPKVQKERSDAKMEKEKEISNANVKDQKAKTKK